MTAAMSAPSGFPTISVVIPTHARPQLLARAVKSVLGQDYPGDIECLVVFDQATPHPVPVETGPGRSISTLVNERTPASRVQGTPARSPPRGMSSASWTTTTNGSARSSVCKWS